MKKIRVCVLVGLIAAFLVAYEKPAYATSNRDDYTYAGDDVEISDEAYEKILRSVPYIISDENELDLSVGREINVYFLTENGLIEADYDLYPIFLDDDIVALARTALGEDGELRVSVSVDFASELNDYYVSSPDSKVAIAYSYEGVYLLDDKMNEVCLQEVCFYEMESISNKHAYIGTVQLNSVDIVYEKSVAPVVPMIANYSTADIARYRTVRVVSNDTVSSCSQGCANGICWAASIAMISNYMKGTSYTAKDIHDLTGIHSNNTGASIIVGGLSSVGVTGYKAYYSFVRGYVARIYSDDSPAYMRIAKNNSGHAIVICGYGYSGTYSVSAIEGFYFKDCNTSSLMYQAFDSNGYVDEIVTTTGTYSFSFWVGASAE